MTINAPHAHHPKKTTTIIGAPLDRESHLDFDSIIIIIIITAAAAAAAFFLRNQNHHHSSQLELPEKKKKKTKKKTKKEREWKGLGFLDQISQKKEKRSN